jgi:tetratricopeptide (TPR) repeat protein
MMQPLSMRPLSMRAAAAALLFVTALAPISAAGSLAALQDAGSGPETLHFLAGNSMQGQVLSDDGSEVQLKTVEGMQMTVRYGDLTPRTVYRLMLARTQKDDATGQVAIGDYAATHDLWAYAQRHYDYAVAADPSMQADVQKKLDALHVSASDGMLADAQHAAKVGRDKDAKHTLSTLVQQFPHEQAADKATTILGDMKEKAKAAHDEQLKAKHDKDTVQALKPISKKLNVIIDKNHDGLANSKDQSRSIEDFKHALKECGLADDDLADLVKKNQDNQQLLDGAKDLESKLQDQYMQAVNNLANAYNLRGSYPDAMSLVNKALARFPDNQQLLNLRAQIAANSSNDGIGAWGGRGRVRVRH